MMTYLNKVLDRISELKSFNKTTVFSISSTAKQEKSYYLTPIRICKDFALSGCIIFDQKSLSILLKKIDGSVNIILADSERIIPFDSKKLCYDDNEESSQLNGTTISSICFQNTKKSKIFEFKPNDLTVNSTWSFLSQRFRFLKGKKITILGAGNIGSKLALKLVECGAEIHLHRRNTYKGKKIVNGLNLIKSESLFFDIRFHSDPIQASFMSDVLIGTTSGYPIIDDRVMNSVKKDCMVVDLGKNNLTRGAIKIASQNSMEIYRADVTSAIESYIYEVLKMEDILKNSYGKKDLNFCNIVSGGFFGNLGDVVVDRIDNPTRVIGISQGDGLLKHKFNEKDMININKLIEMFDISREK